MSGSRLPRSGGSWPVGSSDSLAPGSGGFGASGSSGSAPSCARGSAASSSGGSRTRLALLAVALAIPAGCWRLGEPTPSEAHVMWAAYPETVRVGSPFSFEFGGPVAPDACGRLDTATLQVTPASIELAARRSTFRALCARQHISFYEARPLTISEPGQYKVRAPGGVDLGTLVATDSGPFSAIRTWGEGTIREAAGCWLFGPGWIGGQRVFALDGLSPRLREADTEQILYVKGQLRGFLDCGNWGSRPRIRVDTAWVTSKETGDLYPN